MLYAQSGTILIAHRWIFSPQSQVEVGLSPYTTDHVKHSFDTHLYQATNIRFSNGEYYIITIFKQGENPLNVKEGKPCYR